MSLAATFAATFSGSNPRILGEGKDRPQSRRLSQIIAGAQAVNTARRRRVRSLPKPRSVEALRADPEVAAALAEGAALAIVPLVLDSGRPAKANLSLDTGLLAAIDEAAAARGLTRSAFLAIAARDKIKNKG